MATALSLIFSIGAYEGARGTSHRIRPIKNCEVKSRNCVDTTYGWEGQEDVRPINAAEPVVFADVNDSGTRSWHDVYIFMPNGSVYQKCLSSSMAGCSVEFPYWLKRSGDQNWDENPIVPKEVLELVAE